MTDLTSIEQLIRDEYNAVHAWIALHPYSSALVFFLVGIGVGRLL